MALLASCSLKGTALFKSNEDVRPVVTEPLLSYTGHALATEHRDVIRTVCGDEQYMGLPADCEVVAHSVRYLLEADPTLVVGKVDCQNAFHVIHRPFPYVAQRNSILVYSSSSLPTILTLLANLRMLYLPF